MVMVGVKQYCLDYMVNGCPTAIIKAHREVRQGSNVFVPLCPNYGILT